MFSIHIKSIFIILIALTISACSSSSTKASSEIGNTKLRKINSDKIAKKLQIVMPDNDYTDTNYRFLGTDAELMEIMENEAEFAAIISYDLAMNTNSFEVDKLALETLAYAGYDPMAAINIQNKILASKLGAQEDWQLGPFNPLNLNKETVNQNRQVVASLPKGLTMGTKL